MGGPTLSEFDTARRLPIWTAMSEVFLDTETTDDTYRYIAAEIRRSVLTASEAHAIMRDDVAPAFIFNLFGIAGEWTGWQEDFVRERVLVKRDAIGSRLLVRLFFNGYVRDEWARINAYL
jgi:hypothetical protein